MIGRMISALSWKSAPSLKPPFALPTPLNLHRLQSCASSREAKLWDDVRQALLATCIES